MMRRIHRPPSAASVGEHLLAGSEKDLVFGILSVTIAYGRAKLRAPVNRPRCIQSHALSFFFHLRQPDFLAGLGQRTPQAQHLRLIAADR